MFRERVFKIWLIFLSFGILFVSKVFADEEVLKLLENLDFLKISHKEWRLLWENSKSRILFYPEYIRRVNSEVYALVKIVPGSEREKEIRETFEKTKEKLIKEGLDPGPFWEAIVKDAVESNSYYQIYKADCKKKELFLMPLNKIEAKAGGLRISAIFKVELSPEGYGIALYNHLCQKSLSY